MEKDLIIKKENIFTKIKKFFLNIFSKEKIESENVNIEQDRNITNEFKNNIIVDGENSRILQIQNKYKAGNLLEEDMTDEEHIKLIELYKMQNAELEEKIDIKKKQIRKKLDDLKAS